MSTPDPRAGQEAARLLAAAQEWLRTSAPHLAPVADDGTTCSCPLCQVVAGVREADPESVGRWVDGAVTALGSVLAQAGDLLATGDDAGEPDDGPEPSADPVVPSAVAASSHDVLDDDAEQPPDEAQPPQQRTVRRIPLDPDEPERPRR